MLANNTQIDQIRHEIDKIDTDIIELLVKRFQAVRNIGKIKKKSAIQVTDRERESFLHTRLKKLAQKKHLDYPFLKRVWKEILQESYRIQRESGSDE